MKYRIIKYFLKGILFVFAEWSQHTNNKETETERLQAYRKILKEINNLQPQIQQSFSFSSVKDYMYNLQTIKGTSVFD